MKHQDIYRLLAFEESLFARPDAPPNPFTMDFSGSGGFSEELRPYVARALENDIGKFVALGMRVELPTLEQVRHFIAQSRYLEAKTLIDTELNLADSSVVKAEFLLEECRVHFYTGNFQECIRSVDKCLSQNPIATSLISALQLRVGAAFELGDFRMAHRDLNDIYRFKKLFPHVPSIKYAEMFKIKILARTHGTAAARVALSQVITERLKSTDRLDLDLIHVFLRCQNELNRLDRRPDLPTALACVAVANELSDELYAAMDSIDVLIALPKSLRASYREQVQNSTARFERSSILWRAILGDSDLAPSQTALSYMTNLDRDLSTEPKVEAVNILHPEIESIILPDYHAVVHLNPRSLIYQPSRDQLFRALTVLAAGPVSRESLFTSVWELTYEEERHETVLRTLISRLRKLLNLEIQAKDGMVSITKSVVIK